MAIRKLFIIPLFILFYSNSANAEVILHELQGNHIPFSSLQGKWVVINYWASWCQPCLEEIPELNRFYEKNKHSNIAIFAVHYDALPMSEQKMLVQELNIHYPLLKKDPARPLNLGSISGVPVTFIFNPQGKLSKTLYGPQTAKTLTRAIAAG